MNEMNIGEVRRVIWTLAAVAALSATALAQPAAPATSTRPTTIHVHHHYYYPSGDDLGEVDPGARSSPFEFSYENSAFDEMPSPNRNWGDLGLFAYLGQQGDYMGLIVSRVTPDSPASKLGLVPRDIILTINDLEVGEVSYREIERLFVKLSSTPKIAVTMKVWNAHTRRSDTLKAELVNDAPTDDE
jgi:hypothetical protein